MPLLTPLVLLALPQTTPLAPELRESLDAYLDRRWEGSGQDTRKLVRELERADVDLDDLEAALRAGRASYPPAPYAPGEVHRVELRCDHVDYDTAFFLSVPEDYDPARSWPLVLVGHGGNSEMSQERAERTARSYHRAWEATARAKGLILASPVTGRGWGWIGNSVLFSTISKLQRELHVDPDRIYATGQSMGGHMSWRCGISLADRWGAISPQSGGYDYVENQQVFRLFNVPGYATHGENEPYQIADFNRKIRGWMEERDYPWVIVEKKGRGHEIFADELPRVADFFAAHPRDLYRDRVYVHAGRLSVEEAEPRKPRWPQEHRWQEGRPILHDLFHWVRALPAKDASDEISVQKALVERVSDHELHITSTGTRRLRLYLHPRMFDLERPLIVVANGRRQTLRPRADAATLLELVRETDDRGRIFHAAVDVRIPRDADEVPEPRYD